MSSKGSKFTYTKVSNAELVNNESFERLKKKNHRRKLLRKIFAFVLIPVLCIVFAVVCALLFFNIKTVDVRGCEIYSAEQIVEGTGIEESTNLLSLRPSQIRASLLEKFPYIRSVKFGFSIPDKLILTVVEDTPRFYINIAGEYMILAGDLRVMERYPSKASFADIEDKLIHINLPLVSNAVTGEKLSFFGKNDYSYIIDALKVLIDYSSSHDIQTIDMSDKYHMFIITSDRRLKIILGDKDDLDTKLKFADAVIDSKFDDSVIATLNVEYTDSVIVSLGDERFEK